MNFVIKDNGGVNCKLILNNKFNQIYEYIFVIDEKEPVTPGKVTLRLDVPMQNSFSVWSPTRNFMPTLQANWSKAETNSRGESGEPIHEIIANNDNNVLAVYLSDAKTPLSIKTGIVEETGCLQVDIDLFTDIVSPLQCYETKIRIDERNIKYYELLKSVRLWWENDCGYLPMPINDTVTMPVYSVWYSYHQEINTEKILKDCITASKLGIKSLIIDDGWQTTDLNRGYAYCGDWAVTKDKIADMKQFVEDVHKTGLKFILWYSVPFVGIHSHAFSKFRDKFLYIQKNETGCLDPRYKETRDYLIDIYKKALLNWNIDGFKLDFIDAFRFEKDIPYNEGMDTISLEDAVETLLREITQELTEIKPDICIEFRQRYIGPMINQFGNMLRVGDCPADALKNRRGILDIRMTSGKTPVHSDMIMWDLTCQPEVAADQIINTLFSVQQISVKFDLLPESHMKMLRFYLNFWIENRDVLLNGDLKAESPQANYSMVTAEKNNTIICVLYSKNVFISEKTYDKIYVVNATGRKDVILDVKGDYSLIIKDCMGNKIEEKTIASISKITVPISGMAELTNEFCLNN